MNKCIHEQNNHEDPLNFFTLIVLIQRNNILVQNFKFKILVKSFLQQFFEESTLQP